MPTKYITDLGRNNGLYKFGGGSNVIYLDDGINDYTIYSGGGTDTVHGGGGDDYIDGGKGDDRLWGDRKAPGGTWPGGAYGSDTIYGGDGADWLHGDDGNWNLSPTPTGGGDDELHGGPGNDRLFGEKGNDTLYGDEANDDLFGGDGSDTLYGGDGDDVLIGGFGADHYYGGAGADLFTIEQLPDGQATRIYDFDPFVQLDRINVAGIPLATPGVGGIVVQDQGSDVLLTFTDTSSNPFTVLLVGIGDYTPQASHFIFPTPPGP